jgi:RHS repeat-associated protein
MKRLSQIAMLITLTISLGGTALTQTTPDVEQGFKPYSSYDIFGIDSVNLGNGNLVLRIPLFAYPQRGGKLKFSFTAVYNGKFWTPATTALPPDYLPQYTIWTYGGGGVHVVLADDYVVKNNRYTIPATDSWDQTKMYVNTANVVGSNGSSHLIAGDGRLPVRNGRAMDASGFSIQEVSWPMSDGTCCVYDTAAIAPNGTFYGPFINNTRNITDSNGNQITETQTYPAETVSWTDTVGRTVNGIIPTDTSYGYGERMTFAPGVPVSGTLNCPQGTEVARDIAVPGTDGQTAHYSLCYKQYWIQTAFNVTLPHINEAAFWTRLMSAIVLPNGQAWKFDYDQYADLTFIGLPTGGSISYTWDTFEGCSQSGGINRGRWITSRTVNDGTNSYTWNYTYDNQNGYNGKTTETDPPVYDPATNAFVRNDAVHTFAYAGCSPQEVQTQYFSGQESTGNLLKTVTTSYDSDSNPFVDLPYFTDPGMNIVPTSTTTKWGPNGPSFQTVRQYEPKIQWGYWSAYNNTTTIAPLRIGSVIEQDDYDYDGTILRKTKTNYQWQADANYLASNLLNLPQQVTVLDKNDKLVAQTTYTYDSPSRLVASGIVHADPPMGKRGNLDSVLGYLDPTQGTQPPASFNNTYDTGEVQSVVDPGGHPTSHKYEQCAGSVVTSTTNALNQVITGGYDCNTGLLTSFKDQNQQPSSFTYDIMRRLTSAIFADGGETDYFYDDPSLTVTKRVKLDDTTWRWSYSVQSFDELGREKRSQLADPEGDTYSEITYDALNRKQTVTNAHRETSSPTDGVTRFDYDAIGRMAKITKQDGNTVTTSYSANVTAVTDETGRQRQTTEDALGRLTKVLEPDASSGALSYETVYEYNPNGQLTGVTQKGAAGSDQWRTRAFVYDTLGRLMSANNPESGLITYDYDFDGDVLHKTDARGVIVTSEWDPLHRLLSNSFTDPRPGASPTPGVHFTYEVGTWNGNTLTNMAGRLAYASTDDGNVTAYSYDPLGRVNWQTTCTSDLGCVLSTAQYNLDGTLKNLHYPSGRNINYGYDSARRLNSAAMDSFNGHAANYTYYTVSSFWPSGAPQTKTYGNGVSEFINENNRGQSDQFQVVGSKTWMDLRLNLYDSNGKNNGNVWGINSALSTNRNQTFEYDQLNRIESAAEAGADGWAQQFTYDPWGNLLGVTHTKGALRDLAVAVGTNNRLLDFGYDAAGNLTADGASTYVYDADNRLASVPDRNVTYSYDAGGERATKNFSGKITNFVRFGGQIIGEAEQVDGTTDWSDYIFAGAKRIAKVDTFKDELHLHGVNCSDCGHVADFKFNNAGGLSNYTIQQGDTLLLSQYQSNGARGGIFLKFTDCTYSYSFVHDQNGSSDYDDSVQESWHSRSLDLSPFAGKTVKDVILIGNTQMQNGLTWDISFRDIVLRSGDGTVHVIYSGQEVPSLWWNPGVSSATATIDHTSNLGSDASNVAYYHGDQIGSSRLTSNYWGYPSWSGTYTPFGQDVNAQATTNHYKFTGKERDSETGLDYFGARYYGSNMGRWMSPDWAANATAVPYADFGDPQSLNLYSYVRNNPLAKADADGHEPLTIAIIVAVGIELGLWKGADTYFDSQKAAADADYQQKTGQLFIDATSNPNAPGYRQIDLDGLAKQVNSSKVQTFQSVLAVGQDVNDLASKGNKTQGTGSATEKAIGATVSTFKGAVAKGVDSTMINPPAQNQPAQAPKPTPPPPPQTLTPNTPPKPPSPPPPPPCAYDKKGC